MNVSKLYLIVLAVLMGLGFGTWTARAQQSFSFQLPRKSPVIQTPAPAQVPSVPARISEVKYFTSDASNDRFGIRLMGREVTNYQNVNLGKVTDLAFDLQNGRVVAALVSSGGILGMGQRTVGVPMSAFAYDPQSHDFRINMNPEKFQNAPEVTTAGWSDYFQGRQLADVYRYFGQVPYFAAKNGLETGALGIIYNRADLRGLVVRDGPSILGKVSAFSIDRSSGNLHLMLNWKDGSIHTKSEILATSLQFTASHDALEVNASYKRDQIRQLDQEVAANPSKTNSWVLVSCLE